MVVTETVRCRVPLEWRKKKMSLAFHFEES
jgi:hypothetical protein